MKLNRVQKILLGIIALSLSFSLILNIVQVTSPVAMISKEGYGFFSMLKYSLIDNPIQSLTGGMEALSRMWSLEKENEILRQQIEGIASMQARIEEQQRQIQQLKEMNDLKSVISDYEPISATILSRSAEAWNNVLTIDVGSADGIKVDYAVISTEGLIGRVQSVSEHTSIVKLLTITDSSGQNKVSVQISISENVSADAILESYDYDEQAFVVKLLDSNNTVTENMWVTTSGMGGVFPSGLLVGQVSKVEELTNAIGMNVYVKPAADFQNLDYVYVVRRLGIENE